MQDICIPTRSISRCPLWSHSLVCIQNYLFYVGIGPILAIELICFFDFFLCVGLKTGLINVRKVLDTHLFSNFVTMSFYCGFSVFWCRIWNNVYIFWYISVSLPEHTALLTDITFQLCLYQHHHLTALKSHYPNMENTEIQSNIEGQPILVR